MEFLPADQIEELKQAFAAYDANKDGVHSETEVLALVLSFDPSFTPEDSGVQVRALCGATACLHV